MKYKYSVLVFILLAGTSAWAANTEVIGRTVEGREIAAVRFGSGSESVVLYGGIHGGYEWNTVALTEQLIEFFTANPKEVPEGVRVYIIPCVNIDGLARVTEQGVLQDTKPLESSDLLAGDRSRARFNARGVDLNRNWDANWQPTSQWRNQEVNAGSRPFSEPETRALRDFVLRLRPQVVVSYHSQADGIYYSGKRDRWEPARKLAELYSAASGYPIPQGRGLVGYRITGASGGYFYRQGIPEITIELAGRSSPEFDRNLAGVRALLEAIGDTPAE